MVYKCSGGGGGKGGPPPGVGGDGSEGPDGAAVLGGKGGPGGNSKSKKKTAASKTTCLKCNRSTNKTAANKDGGVQCNVCDRWWHGPCMDISSEMFGMLCKVVEEGMQIPWRCPSCESAGTKLKKMVEVLTNRVEETEKGLEKHDVRIAKIEDKNATQDAKIVSQDREIKELRDQLAKLGDNSGASAIREMDERAAKECNVVVHGLRESSRLEARERVQDDMDAFKQVVGVMGVVDGDEGIRFARRLGDREKGRNGEGRDKTVPRPMLIGFINKGIQERILDSSWRLVDSNNPDICRISVVRDLTARQRGREQEMVREAAKSNLERQQEDIVGNLAFKVVGRRGEKRIIKAPLRRGEVLNELGEVSWEEGNNFLGERRRLTGRRRLGEPSVSGANLEPIPSRSSTSTPDRSLSLSSTVREEDLRSREATRRQREDRQITRERLDRWTTVGDRRGKTRERTSTSVSPPGNKSSPAPRGQHPRPSSARTGSRSSS